MLFLPGLAGRGLVGKFGVCLELGTSCSTGYGGGVGRRLFFDRSFLSHGSKNAVPVTTQERRNPVRAVRLFVIVSHSSKHRDPLTIRQARRRTPQIIGGIYRYDISMGRLDWRTCHNRRKRIVILMSVKSIYTLISNPLHQFTPGEEDKAMPGRAGKHADLRPECDKSH